nr:hypothetical protein [Tanacetum cinerariifolium]
MSLLQEPLDACVALTKRVEHLEYDKMAQALEITKIKKRVKKLEKGNKVRVLKLRRLKRVGTSQRIDTSDDTVIDDESNQGRIIDEMNKDDDVDLMDKEEDKKDEEAKVVENVQEDEPAKVQEVVDVVTTAKLVTEVVTATSETVTAASIIIFAAEPQVHPLKKKQQIKMDEEYAGKLHAELNKDIDWDVAIDHVKLKAKEDPAVQRYQIMKRKPQTEAQARKNMMTTYVQSLRLTKRRKLNEEVEDLKRQLEIMPDEDDDVYTEATPLARKNFDREDLEALWNLVKEWFSTSKPKNFSDDFLLTTLGEMFEKPDRHAQVWKNQRTIHGQEKVKSWKLLESCGVHIITFTTTQLILLIERRYPLSRFTLDQMLNNCCQAKLLLLDNAVEARLMLLSHVNDAKVKLMLSRQC